MSGTSIGVYKHGKECEKSGPDSNSRNPLINKARRIHTLFKNTKIVVHILVCTFAVSSWIDMNGMWAQLPLLVEKAHEGWTLPSYITVISQIANIGPLIFVLISCLAPQTKPKLEKVTSFMIIITGVVASFLLAFFWEYTTYIGGSMHSTALLTLNFFLALSDCTSSVSFYAFMAYMKPEYIATLFVGEGLSSLIPAMIALGQGVGQISCNGTMAINVGPSFSVRVYFIILSGILLVSAVAFLLLNFWDYCKSEMIVQAPKSADAIIHQPRQPIAEGDDDNLSQTSQPRREVASSVEVLLVGSNGSNQSSGVCQSIRILIQVTDIPLWRFFLLLALIILINMSLTTFLSSIQIYSVLPYGMEYYHLTTTLPQIANPVACVFALFVMAEHTVTIVIITCLGHVCAGYIIYAAAMSPTPPLHGESGGGELAVALWVLVTLLLIYAKVCIAGALRKHGRNALIWGGACTQIGALIGAVVGFVLVNEYSLFKDAPYCP